MARTAIAKGSWVSLGTTTVDTLFTVEGGKARIITGVTTGVNFDDGNLMSAGESIIFSAGVSVSAVTISDGVAITAIAAGV